MFQNGPEQVGILSRAPGPHVVRGVAHANRSQPAADPGLPHTRECLLGGDKAGRLLMPDRPGPVAALFLGASETWHDHDRYREAAEDQPAGGKSLL